MTDRKQALTDLLEKVEAGEWDGRDVWPLNFTRLCCSALGTTDHTDVRVDLIADAYDGSLDAAKALHEAVLPRHYAQVHMWPMPEMCRVDIGGGHTGRDDNPARAWLIAILKALIAKEEEL